MVDKPKLLAVLGDAMTMIDEKQALIDAGTPPKDTA
jgi:hypothetical protein